MKEKEGKASVGHIKMTTAALGGDEHAGTILQHVKGRLQHTSKGYQDNCINKLRLRSRIRKATHMHVTIRNSFFMM